MKSHNQTRIFICPQDMWLLIQNIREFISVVTRPADSNTNSGTKKGFTIAHLLPLIINPLVYCLILMPLVYILVPPVQGLIPPVHWLFTACSLAHPTSLLANILWLLVNITCLLVKVTCSVTNTTCSLAHFTCSLVKATCSLIKATSSLVVAAPSLGKDVEVHLVRLTWCAPILKHTPPLMELLPCLPHSSRDDTCRVGLKGTPSKDARWPENVHIFLFVGFLRLFLEHFFATEVPFCL